MLSDYSVCCVILNNNTFNISIQMVALFSKMCHLKDKDIIRFSVLTEKGENEANILKSSAMEER